MRNSFWAELERRDVVFRLELTSEGRRKKMPFAIAAGDYEQEIGIVLKKLEAGDISQAEAVKLGTKIMEGYYGQT